MCLLYVEKEEERKAEDSSQSDTAVTTRRLLAAIRSSDLALLARPLDRLCIPLFAFCRQYMFMPHMILLLFLFFSAFFYYCALDDALFWIHSALPGY